MPLSCCATSSAMGAVASPSASWRCFVPEAPKCFVPEAPKCPVVSERFFCSRHAVR